MILLCVVALLLKPSKETMPQGETIGAAKKSDAMFWIDAEVKSSKSQSPLKARLAIHPSLLKHMPFRTHRRILAGQKIQPAVQGCALADG